MAVPITLSLSVGDQNSNNSYLDALSQVSFVMFESKTIDPLNVVSSILYI